MGKGAERGDVGGAGSAKVSFKSSRLPGSSVRRKLEKKGASCHIHRFLEPFSSTVPGGSAGPEVPGHLNPGAAGGDPLTGDVSHRAFSGGGEGMAAPWPLVSTEDRGHWAAARMVLRRWSTLVSSFLGPAPNSEVDTHLGSAPSGWHIRMTRAAEWVEDQTNTLRCQTP